jgi:putative IMPACT (imprinted ancient) family translation regulator
LGSRGEREYSSDGGEPAGTAGKPILSAIKRNDMVNLLVIVTRYFGGIKLGVRGLIEAYGQAASAVLERAVRVKRIRSRKLAICLPYAIIGDVAHLLEVHGSVDGLAEAPRWSYDADVEVVASVKESVAAQVTAVFDELRARKRIYSWKWLSEMSENQTR